MGQRSFRRRSWQDSVCLMARGPWEWWQRGPSLRGCWCWCRPDPVRLVLPARPARCTSSFELFLSAPTCIRQHFSIAISAILHPSLFPLLSILQRHIHIHTYTHTRTRTARHAPKNHVPRLATGRPSGAKPTTRLRLRPRHTSSAAFPAMLFGRRTSRGQKGGRRCGCQGSPQGRRGATEGATREEGQGGHRSQGTPCAVHSTLLPTHPNAPMLGQVPPFRRRLSQSPGAHQARDPDRQGLCIEELHPRSRRDGRHL